MAVAAENCQITFSSNACGTLLLNLKKKRDVAGRKFKTD
jgi:hypothetical protein